MSNLQNKVNCRYFLGITMFNIAIAYLEFIKCIGIYIFVILIYVYILNSNTTACSITYSQSTKGA